MIRAENSAAVLSDTEHRPLPPAGRAVSQTVRPLKIIHVHQKTSLSTGSVQQMLQAATGLRERGHSIVIATPPSEPLDQALHGSGIDISYFPFRNLLDLRTIIGLRRLIQTEEPDVVHVHKGRAHWLSLLALAGHLAPALIVNRGVSFPLSPLNRGKYRSSRTDCIITVCDAIRRIIETTGRVRPDKIEVVYAGTDVERFDRTRVDPAAFRQELNLPPDAFVLFHSGTRSWKGWREVVDAFASVQSRIPHSHLLIAGNDSESRERRVRDYIAGTTVGDRIHVLGYRNDIERVIAASDVTIDASWEGTGITGTIRESMAIGTPVVATDCGGNRELLSDPGFGWLVPPRDHERLVSAIMDVAMSPEKRSQVARRAEELVRTRFSIAHRIDRLEQIYTQHVNRRRRALGGRREMAGLSG